MSYTPRAMILDELNTMPDSMKTRILAELENLCEGNHCDGIIAIPLVWGWIVIQRGAFLATSKAHSDRHWLTLHGEDEN